MTLAATNCIVNLKGEALAEIGCNKLLAFQKCGLSLCGQAASKQLNSIENQQLEPFADAPQSKSISAPLVPSLLLMWCNPGIEAWGGDSQVKKNMWPWAGPRRVTGGWFNRGLGYVVFSGIAPLPPNVSAVVRSILCHSRTQEHACPMFSPTCSSVWVIPGLHICIHSLIPENHPPNHAFCFFGCPSIQILGQWTECTITKATCYELGSWWATASLAFHPLILLGLYFPQSFSCYSICPFKYSFIALGWMSQTVSWFSCSVEPVHALFGLNQRA